MNLENSKRIMYEKKTTLPSLRNHVWKTVNAKTEKINELLTLISTKIITELNELIYAGAKLDCKKIGFTLKKNESRISKSGWKIRLETQIGNLQQEAKMIKQR